MSLAATVAAMTAAGCSAEQINAVVQAHAAADEERLAKRREANRVRQQRKRERDASPSRVTERDEALQSVTERDTPPEVSPKDNKSNPLPNPPLASSLRSEATAIASEFAESFWPLWPHKVGKPDAAKSFLRARRDGATLAAILAGVERYVRDKPVDRPWLNPATFLNQRRWEDQPAPSASARAGPAPQAPRRSSIDLAAERLLAESLGLETPRRNQPDPFDGPTLDLGAAEWSNRA